MDSRRDLGRTGEDLASDLYRRRGFEVIERNYRCRDGEIDIVARRGKLLVFCEVKARASNRWGEPAEAVGIVKQQRLRRLASRWLSERSPGAAEIRFDVVSIVARGSRYEVSLIPEAF
jgi:putative endonuclease